MKQELIKKLGLLEEKYDDLEDQIFDLEDFEPDEDDKKEHKVWEEERELLINRLNGLDLEIEELKKTIDKITEFPQKS